MKRIVSLLVAAFTTCLVHAQINEKDTLTTTAVAQNGSINFQADILPDYINLNWTKGPHEFTGYFELYRSADGIAYNIVRQFHPQSFEGNDNSYSYRDEDPLRGKNYYRLVGYDKFTNERRIVELVADYKNQPRKLYPSVMSRGQQLYINNYDGQEL